MGKILLVVSLIAIAFLIGISIQIEFWTEPKAYGALMVVLERPSS